jgi:hypothetical protein
MSAPNPAVTAEPVAATLFESVEQSAPTRRGNADMQQLERPAQTPARKVVRAWQGYNRRRWEFEKDVLAVDERAPFVCECTSDACLHAIELTMYEFEAAHMCPTWCAVRPGHVMSDDGGRVVLQQPHFCVVELAPLRG